MTKTHSGVPGTSHDNTQFSERPRKAQLIFYVTNTWNLSSEVIPEDDVKAIGVGWLWLFWYESTAVAQDRLEEAF